MIEIAIVILVIFDLYLLHELTKHEIAVAELLYLHPELWADEEDDDG